MSAPLTPGRIRRIRKRRKLTQREAAASIGVHLVTWQSWESGKHAPTGVYETILTNWAYPPKED